MTAPLHVALIGPELEARGGIASVCRAWLDSPVLGDTQVSWIPTMKDGPTLRKGLGMLRRQATFVKRLAGGLRPDVFHIHLSYHSSFYRKAAYLAEAKATGRPVLLHFHAPDLTGFARSKPVHLAALRRACAAADGIVVLSQAMAQELHELLTTEPAATTSTPVHVVYNPVVLEDFSCPPRADTTEPAVLFMGELGQRKGTWDLVEAIPAVLEQVPGARFRFGGNGDEARLRKRIDELGVAHQVDVLGWVSGEDKLAAFRSAHVYCLPSYHEGLPMSILEAMAAGLPVVATPIAGVPESVIDHETGFLVEPGDVAGLARSLTTLLSDLGTRRRMGLAGRRLAEERFDVDVVVSEVLDLWARVAAEHP